MLDFKKILTSIADIGQTLLGKKFSKSRDLKSLITLCDDLISYKGTASGIAIAREISEIYKVLDTDQKLSFFKEINSKYKPNLNNIDYAIKNFASTKSYLESTRPELSKSGLGIFIRPLVCFYEIF